MSINKEERQPLLDPNSPPPDNKKLAWLSFMTLGIGVLFPWNAFISAFDYFDLLYPGFPFDFTMSIAYNAPSVIMMLLNVKFGPKFSFASRILTGFALLLVLLATVPVISLVFDKSVSLWIVTICIFFAGCAGATVFSGLMGLASLFPPDYVGATMSGMGIAGIFSIGLRVITKVSFPNTNSGVRTSAFFFFGIAGGFMLICIFAYKFLMNLRIATYYIDIYNSKKSEHQEVHHHDTGVLTVFKHLWKHAMSVYAVFFVTLALFPGMTSIIPDSTGRMGDWFQIIMTALFMVFDYIGRTLPGYVKIFSPKVLWIPVLLRGCFFALFILCINPRVFDNNIYAYVFMATFAISNGYLGTLCMMYGPTEVQPHQRETAGLMMSFFLNFGIFTAVNFAMLLLYLVTGTFSVN